MFLPLNITSIGAELGLRARFIGTRPVVWAPRWCETLSYQSVFCRALVSNNILTEPQMLRAVLRYRLGCSRSGGVIFWQIDQHEETYNGKIMYYRPDCHRDKNHNPNWVGSILARRYGWKDTTSRHCFFGLHQLSNSPFAHTDAIKLLDEKYEPLPPCHSEPSRGISPIAVVEAEKTAVIMSEAYPQFMWMACGGLNQLQPDKFRPLRGHNLVLFPDTDTTGEAFNRWSEAAQTVQNQIFWEDSPPIHVSDLLERQATDDQKQRKIDLADFWIETIRLSPQKS
jgi:hypothetical protein